MSNEWLKTLKVGDTAVYDDGYSRTKHYNLVTVEKITPTGIIKTNDGKSWNTEGKERGATPARWARTNSLQPYTEEVKEHIKREWALNYLRKADLNVLPTDKLIEIVGSIELYAGRKEE